MPGPTSVSVADTLSGLKLTSAFSKVDPSSLATPESDLKCTHINLDWTLDFITSTVDAKVILSCETFKENLPHLILDATKSILVTKVNINSSDASLEVPFEVMTSEKDGINEIFGNPLKLILPSTFPASTFAIEIKYQIDSTASAFQWLTAEQTAEKLQPYMFSQCQAIHARSMVPCIDSPAMKVTYEAKVSVPTWCTVLMSAISANIDGQPTLVENLETTTTESKSDGIMKEPYHCHFWRQDVPMPPYLIAIAAGVLESREISPRVKIWAEPSMVDQAKFEFEDTESFLSIAESLTCPYMWERYDLLCLPPSFPYGGMENPCLTFVTPTLLAGDKSLADVVAHEISHSWTGNLITNHTWEHFWLNEGWTMWLQRKIMKRMKGESQAFFDLDASQGYIHLEDDINAPAFQKNPELTRLVPPLDGVDPDDSFSSVPYEKGFTLLYTLESIVGHEAFEQWAKEKYIQTFKYKTVTTYEFIALFLETFADNETIANFEWEKWLFNEGLPDKDKYITYDDSMKKQADSLSQIFLDATDFSVTIENDFDTWPTIQKLVFLTNLIQDSTNLQNKEAAFTEDKCKWMDTQVKNALSETKNSEVRFKWLLLCINNGNDFVLENALDFVSSQGRMKFVRPLYRALTMSNNKNMIDAAVANFQKHELAYHPICRKMVSVDIKNAVEG